MYSWEIEQFIKERDFCVSGLDLDFLITPSNNPQVNGIKFNPGQNTYVMTTNDNYCFFFKAVPCVNVQEKEENVKTRRLVKKN